MDSTQVTDAPVVPVPSFEIFAAHGLADVEIDQPPSTLSPGLLIGHARLYSAPAYPLLARIDPGERVKVRWLATGDEAASRTFGIQAQIIALDCSRRQKVSGAQSSPRKTSSSSLMALVEVDDGWSDSEQRAQLWSTAPRCAGLDVDVLAWWTDAEGQWLVTREEPMDPDEHMTPLREYWESVFTTSRSSQEDVHPLPSSKQAARGPGWNQLDSSPRDSCLIFAQIVYCLKVRVSHSQEIEG